MTKYDNDNVFAKIIRKEIPAKIAYEDDNVIAFHDIEPKAKVHVLIIPKGPYVDSYDFLHNGPDDLIMGFYKSLPIIAQQLAIVENGYKLLSNAGVNAGQEVFHYHIHMMSGDFQQ